MKRVLYWFALLVVGCAGCEDITIDTGHHRRAPCQTCPNCPDGQCRPIDWKTAGDEVPAMDLPLELREHNWGTGSCVHASTVMCLRWQQQFEMADYWRQTYSGGESLDGLVGKMDKNSLQYAYTSQGDPEFLEWATRTRRGAVIFYFPNHSICFVGHHGDQAWLLDNNREDHFLQVPWDTFVRNWKGYGGVALTPIYVPPPPSFVVAL